MQLVDLRTFKTRKCDHSHHHVLGPSFLNCPNYHSKFDRRRNPFSDNHSAITYSETYIQDFYSTSMSCHFVEYLFHPNNYKKIPCKLRFNKNYQNAAQSPKPCPHIYCPYLHQNEDVSSLQPYRDLPLAQILDPQQKITGVNQLANLLQQPESNIHIYQKEIDSLKNEFKKMRAEIKHQKKEPQAPPLPKQQSTINKIVNAQNTNKATVESWYTPYTYFQYGQILPIIEDRHHQFKNFRDIINNTITPIVMKYIAAFLNSEGGVLYIGIDDSSIVNGFEITQHQFDKFLLSIDKEGKFNLYPPLMPQKYSVKRIPVYHHRKHKQLWVIQIKVTPFKQQKKTLTTYNRECYMRMNASTHKLDAMDLIQYLRLNQEQKLTEKEYLKQATRALQKSGASKSAEQLAQLKQMLNQILAKIDILARLK